MTTAIVGPEFLLRLRTADTSHDIMIRGPITDRRGTGAWQGWGGIIVVVRRRDSAVLRQIGTLFNVGTIGDLTDGQLLERFATDPDEVAELAFSALVERHGAMVWRVCLAILRDEHDAQDAFQATFLVLVRKARSLWVRDSLGPWLHQVACRTASCLRATVIRRRKLDERYAELAPTLRSTPRLRPMSIAMPRSMRS